MSIEERAAKLRDQVMQTWSPPSKHGQESEADIAQTATMLSLAFVFGRNFLGSLTDNQEAAVTSGLQLFEKVVK